MSAWYFFHAEPRISKFSLEIYIPLLKQLWQTVLVGNLYPIFILLNQLAVKITPAESFLWMHLHQFQYLSMLSLVLMLLYLSDIIIPLYELLHTCVTHFTYLYGRSNTAEFMHYTHWQWHLTNSINMLHVILRTCIDFISIHVFVANDEINQLGFLHILFVTNSTQYQARGDSYELLLHTWINYH